jgi:hypothetical protein
MFPSRNLLSLCHSATVFVFAEPMHSVVAMKMPIYHPCKSTFSALLLLLLLTSHAAAHNHNGPPLRIVTDQKAGPYTVSVWSHPHVGAGKFFVTVEPAAADLIVEIAVQPASGRLPEKTYVAHRTNMHHAAQYETEAAFDAPELWRVRVLLHSNEGGGEITTTVETSLPGPARWELLLFILPFAAVGFLAIRVITRVRKLKQKQLQAS